MARQGVPPLSAKKWATVGAVAAVVLVVAGLLGFPSANRWITGRWSGAGPIQSLAVLPLANLSGDPEREYLADGMTEELITQLGKAMPLRVISRQPRNRCGAKSTIATCAMCCRYRAKSHARSLRRYG